MSQTPANEPKKEKDMKDVLAAAEKFKCAVQRSQKFVEEFLSEPMCGKCHPCALGSFEALVRLKRISSGSGSREDVAAIKRIADDMLEASRCIKGKDTAKFLLASLETGAFDGHLGGSCAGKECAAYIIYKIVPDKCVLCGDCKSACKYNAVQGEKKVSYRSGYLPYEIRQKRCVKCGDCYTACKFGAIEIIEEKTGVLV